MVVEIGHGFSMVVKVGDGFSMVIDEHGFLLMVCHGHVVVKAVGIGVTESSGGTDTG